MTFAVTTMLNSEAGFWGFMTLLLTILFTVYQNYRIQQRADEAKVASEAAKIKAEEAKFVASQNSTKTTNIERVVVATANQTSVAQKKLDYIQQQTNGGIDQLRAELERVKEENKRLKGGKGESHLPPANIQATVEELTPIPTRMLKLAPDVRKLFDPLAKVLQRMANDPQNPLDSDSLAIRIRSSNLWDALVTQIKGPLNISEVQCLALAVEVAREPENTPQVQ